MKILEIILVIINIIISLFYTGIRKQKIIKILLVLISFAGFCWGYILENAFIMDAIYPEKRMYSGKLIMIICLIIQLLLFLKLIIDIFKNKKEGGKT